METSLKATFEVDLMDSRAVKRLLLTLAPSLKEGDMIDIFSKFDQEFKEKIIFAFNEHEGSFFLEEKVNNA